MKTVRVGVRWRSKGVEGGAWLIVSVYHPFPTPQQAMQNLVHLLSSPVTPLVTLRLDVRSKEAAEQARLPATCQPGCLLLQAILTFVFACTADGAPCSAAPLPPQQTSQAGRPACPLIGGRPAVHALRPTPDLRARPCRWHRRCLATPA